MDIRDSRYLPARDNLDSLDSWGSSFLNTTFQSAVLKENNQIVRIKQVNISFG